MARTIRLFRLTARIPVDFVTSSLRAAAGSGDFNQVRTFCVFIGHGRSGHSLVGSLLDAHPAMVVSHELNALRYVRLGFRREQLFHLVIDRSRAFEARGRRWAGYTSVVPGQWQGRWRSLRVIGDKKGFGTTFELRRHPQLVDTLRERIACPVRWLHVIRNPFDNIATMYRRRVTRGESLGAVAARYFRNCETVRETRERLDGGEMLDVWHEDFLADPAGELTRICAFLGEETSGEYLSACAGIVFDTPHRSRLEVDWDPTVIARVNERMTAFPHLRRYTFES